MGRLENGLENHEWVCEMIRIKKRALDFPAWLISKWRLTRLMSTNELEEIVDVPNKYIGHGYYDRIHAEQDPQEIIELARLVKEHKPQVIVEIGTYKGGTLFIWSRLNPWAKKIVSIDLPGGHYGGGYSDKRIKLYRHFCYDHVNTAMHFIRENSHLKSTFASLKRILNGQSIDFLYIDADHTYEGVKTDFEMYSQLMSPNGIIGFHDIRNTKENHQVMQFWNDIKVNYQHKEIIGENSKTGNGVIFWKG